MAVDPSLIVVDTHLIIRVSTKEHSTVLKHVVTFRKMDCLYRQTCRLGWLCRHCVHHQLFRLLWAQMDKQMNRNVLSSLNMHCKLFTLSDLQMEVTYAEKYMLSPYKIYRWS